MNIDEMEASTELNILMADRVMGWSIDPEGCYLDRNNGYADTGFGTIDNTHNKPAWMPSIRIAAAWQVVEKLEDRGYYISLTNESKAWWCGVYDSNSGRWDRIGSWDERLAETTAATVPLAICRAALLAIQQE